MIKKLINLQMFGEGGGDGGTATAGTATAPVAEGNQNNLSVGSSRSKNPLASVQYGKQEGVAGSDNATDSSQPLDKKAQFEAMIRGEYKDVFNEKTQGIIDKRFKETKSLESYKNDVAPLIDLMYAKYGVSDIKSLSEAINEDSSIWEQSADAEGLTVEQYKQKLKLETENKQFKEMVERQQREQARQAQYNAWLNEVPSVQQLYPNFKLEVEARNKNFVDLLARGVDMKTAYEVIHLNDIKMGVARATQQTVANSIRANGLRPSENGVSAQNGVVTKSDPTKFSKADRAEIARRVARGEIIKL